MTDAPFRVLEEIRRSQTEDEIVAQDMEAERLKKIQDIRDLNEQLTNMSHCIATNYKKIIDAVSMLMFM